MVVLAASVCTKGGKAVISRQFRDMTSTRIESLLAAFPKLIPTNTQHTSVETPEVRYVYQPLEDLYIVLITNKASNILQDIDTLQLFARVVSDISRSADEREISKNAFELLWAFDEIITQGYREQVNLQQVRSILEMESHEEKIQEIIARNKEAEAKEELKRRAKQLEMQRREQQRRAAGGGGGYLGGGPTGYSSVPRFEAPEPTPSRITTSSPAPASASRPPAFKGSGMKLGSKKTKQAELLDQLGGEVLAASESSSLLLSTPASRPSESPVPKKTGSDRGSVPEVTPSSIHIAVKETLSLSLPRDGGVQAFELKGDMNLTISDAAFSHIKLSLADSSSDFGGKDLQFKQHPHVTKFPASGNNRVIALKDVKRAFPVNQSIGVLKWRYSGSDESLVPLSLTVWPSPSNDGTVEVSLEYELVNEGLTLYDVVISIPLPTGSYPTVTSDDHPGSWSLNPSTHSLAWSIPIVDPTDDSSKSGSFAFTVGGDDTAAFFPVDIKFVASGSLAGVSITKVELVGEQSGVVDPENFSIDSLLTVDEFEVVDG